MKEWTDWYKVSSAMLSEYGVASIINYYQNSVVNMIMKVYSEYPWNVWKFEQVRITFVFN